MAKLIYKAAIYTASVCLCIILFVQLGSELIVQIAMMIEGVSDRDLLDKESGAAIITVYAILAESIAGFISGWYLAEWISEKIWAY
jgi:hypothetical protein